MAHPVLFLLTPPSHFVKSASNIPANIKKVEYLFDMLNDYDHINAFSFIFTPAPFLITNHNVSGLGGWDIGHVIFESLDNRGQSLAIALFLDASSS